MKKITILLCSILNIYAQSLDNINGGGLQDDEENRKSDFNILEAYDLGRIEKIIANSPDSNDSINVITSKDIEDSASNNIAEALRYTSGVFYTPAYGNRGEPGIKLRGFSSGQVGFFLDGIPMHSIYDKQSDWGQFSSFGLSEISISKGYTSPQYGMNTLGGAINMITSKPLDKLEIFLKYGFISNNENQVATSIGSNLGKYYLQANYSFINRISYPLSYKFQPTSFQTNLEKRNSYFSNHTLRLKAGYEPNENHEYSLNFIYERGKKGGTLNDISGDLASAWNWPHYDKITAYLLGNSKITESLSINTRLYYDSFYNELKGKMRGSDLHSIYDDYTLGGILTLQYDFNSNINLKAGINIKNDNHKNIDVDGISDPQTRLSDLSTSLFVEYAHRFNNMFRLMLSASYDRNDMLKAIVPENDNTLFSIQGGSAQSILFIDWNNYLSNYINIGYKTSLPTLKSRYSTIWGTRTPNPNIMPESGINYEIGTSFQYSSSKGSLAVFFNDLTNMLVELSDPTNSCIAGSGCYKLTNAKEGYSYGVEVSFNQGFWEDRINLGLNYTYMQKITNAIFNPSGTKLYKILNYPNHIVNLNFSISPISKIDLIANATYQSPQWISENIKNKHIFLLDFKANYRIIDSLQFSLGAYNLLDANYYYSEGSYMPGRRIFLNLEYKY